MISRSEAYDLLISQNLETSLVNHGLEAEAVMRGLARKLGHDEELWGITGLLHDIDYMKTKECAEKHGLISSEILEGKLPEEAIQAIKAHNFEENGIKPETAFDFALRCGETVTGLVSANALVRPNKMEGMKPKSLKKKMKDKAFAASVNREVIKECEKIGLDLSEFFSIAISEISTIADEVGLV